MRGVTRTAPAGAFGLLLTLALFVAGCGGGTYVFPGLTGPKERTTVPASVAAKPEDFDHGTASRLALLVTSADSSWLGLAHGLRSIGIPARITRDAGAALAHRVVVLYPADAGEFPPGIDADALRRFVEEGGTLIGIAARGAAMKGIFGYGEVSESQDRLELHLLPGGQFSDPRELTLPLGKPSRGETKRALRSLLYPDHLARTIATYEDGGAAMILNRLGEGAAIAIGIDIGRMMSVGYNNRDEYIARGYVGEYEPATDVFLRFLAALYAAGEPAAVTLGTVPFGKSISILLTHDIDFQESIANAVAFAQLEKQAGVAGTYFVQTKYVADFYDVAFFNEENLRFLKQIKDLGMEIASHSVSHSHQFAQFPAGTGRETYPEYTPRVIDHQKTADGSVLGELRVSKFLLDSLLDTDVVSFRPGHLSNPYSLPESLAAAGYAFSSSSTANDSLTHLPFQLTYGRGFDADVPIFEFPVTIEDELIPAIRRLEPALELAGKLKTYGGLCNVLIHTSRLGDEIEFERRFIEATRADGWFSTLGDFGRFWRARNLVELDARRAQDGGMVVHLVAPAGIEGLALSVPSGWTIRSAPAGTEATAPGRVVLPRIEGPVDLIFQTAR